MDANYYYLYKFEFEIRETFAVILYTLQGLKEEKKTILRTINTNANQIKV